MQHRRSTSARLGEHLTFPFKFSFEEKTQLPINCGFFKRKIDTWYVVGTHTDRCEFGRIFCDGNLVVHIVAPNCPGHFHFSCSYLHWNLLCNSFARKSQIHSISFIFIWIFIDSRNTKLVAVEESSKRCSQVHDVATGVGFS